MLAKRIVPCLDIKDGTTVKGINFVNFRDAGDPVELGAQYSDQGADELVYLDITASHEGRKTFTELVKENIALAQKLGILINDSFVYDILAILNKMDPKSSTSAKLDWDNGNQTEVEGLIYNVLKNGEKLELKMVTYKKVSEKLKRQSKV